MKKTLVKQKFDYDLGGLASYVDQLSADIISEAVLSPTTMKYVNVIPGIKGTQNVNLLSETLVVQTGTTCGFNDAGTVEFTTAPVTVQSFKTNQQLCLEELNVLWLGQYLNAGSYNETAPFETAITDLQTKQIKRFNEDILWNASSGSSSFSGYIELLNNTAGVVTPTGFTFQALCSVTGATVQEKAEKVLEQIDTLIEALDRNIYGRQDLVCFMNEQQFKCYLKSIRQVNNFHFTEPTLGQVYEVFHPQTNIKVVAAPGMYTSNLIVIGPQQYFLAGVDLMSDEDSFRAWWSMDNQAVRLMSAWKIGSALAFPQFFVTNGL
jgi:hypothetical protein